MSDLFMVFDVESIGLHGEGFAVGLVVVNRAGETLDEATFACDPSRAYGAPNNHAWVRDNVPAMDYDCLTPEAVRNCFWARWLHWKEQGAVLVADCCWPVEARFLAACVDDYLQGREWEGPYPLHDLASILLAYGAEPLAVTDRLPGELPAHHPLNDARHSARQLIAALSAWNRRSADERDAARYRALREMHWNESRIACVVNPKAAVKLGYDCPSGDRLDAAIDAEIARLDKGEKK